MDKNLILKSDYIISLGCMLSKDNDDIEELIIEAIAKNNAEFVYMHPIDDIDMKVYYSQFVKYEVGSEEGICSLLLEFFTQNPTQKVEAFINDLDLGYISAESSAGEEEFEEMLEKAQDKTNKTLLLGDDLFCHERVENIARLIRIFKEFTDFNVVAVSDKYNELIENASLDAQEVDDLRSYNGTVIYSYKNNEDNNMILGSNSFSRVAKVSDGDTILVNFQNQKVERLFKVDKNLQGTIALCAINETENNWISNGYRYKQVKIEKVDA